MNPDFEWTTKAEKMKVVAYWWKEQSGKCCICGHAMLPYTNADFYQPNAATVEHLIPKRENGPNTVGNVRLAHGRCNHALGALWEQNRQRVKQGLHPMSAKWAINSAAGRR